jgi:nitrogen fixation/metabolism regulation signal transduction histidine kinase
MLSVVRPVLRELAGVLAGLFDRDRRLAIELNRAQRRLLDANERRVLGLALDEVRADVQQAFLQYAFAADKRRELAADIGEATGDLIAGIQAAGFSEPQARNADVWALRNGIYHEGPGHEGC